MKCSIEFWRTKDSSRQLETQKHLFGDTPRPRQRSSRGGNNGRDPIGKKSLSPASVGSGVRSVVAGLRSGAVQQARLSRVAAFGAQGHPCFAAVPFHHTGQGSGSRTDHSAARRLSTGIAPVVFALGNDARTRNYPRSLMQGNSMNGRSCSLR